ncbi:MAG: NTP transferase domain-containing protein [Ktedonobacteraceae bacterium]
MSQVRSTAAIILAAGSSSRMGGGRHKLLLPLEDRPVLAHVIDATLTSQARPILVVLGHQADQVRAHIAAYATHPDITLIENPDYLQGMSTSMRVGLEVLISHGYKKVPSDSLASLPHPRDAINRVPTNSSAEADSLAQSPRPGDAINRVPTKLSSDVDSALIILGDQPLVTPRIIDTLISTWQMTGKRIVAPLYDRKRGNPILFAASLFPELLEVTGDEGGRSIVERHRQELETVELGDAMASYDVDTWEAYQQVVEAWQRKKAQESQS